MGTSHLGTLYMIELVPLIKADYRVSQNGTSPIVTLEERFEKARSSMSLRTYLMAIINIKAKG